MGSSHYVVTSYNVVVFLLLLFKGTTASKVENNNNCTELSDGTDWSYLSYSIITFLRGEIVILQFLN